MVVISSVSLLPMIRLALLLPALVGMKSTSASQLSPPAKFLLSGIQLLSGSTRINWLLSAPPRLRLWTARLPVPLLVMTTRCARDALLISVLVKVNVAGNTVMSGACATPVPLNATAMVDSSLSLLAMVSSPVVALAAAIATPRGAVLAFGVKVTPTVQLAPGFKTAPQLLRVVNCPLLSFVS